MTQEEKAKAYDKALERAKAMIKIASNQDEAKGFAKTIFPELAESEDEKVREALVALVKCNERSGYKLLNNVPTSSMIAWLEKQGGQKEYTFKSITRLLDMIEPTDRAKAYCQKLIDALAKEGYNIDAKIVKEALKGMNGEDVSMAVMDEQKSVNDTDEDIVEAVKDTSILDMIEPKFHEGDWVVWQDKCYKVNYNGCGYELIGQNGLRTSLEYGTVDTSARLWNIIQDAKDGDVLAGSIGEVILMFRGIGNREWDDVIDYHCYYDCYREDFIVQKDVNYWGNTENNQLKPATKEQRDLLFQKMKEAGYVLDGEKKELKKINWSDHIKYNPNAPSIIKEYAWSEEDEEILRSIIATCELAEQDRDSSPARHLLEMQLNWLKSLKARYTWKPSDEQMEALEYIINNAHNTSHSCRIAKELLEQLKKLK